MVERACVQLVSPQLRETAPVRRTPSLHTAVQGDISSESRRTPRRRGCRPLSATPSSARNAKEAAKAREKEEKEKAEAEAKAGARATKQAEKEARAAAKQAEKEARAAAKQTEKDAKAAAKQTEKEARAAAKQTEKDAKAAAKQTEKEAKTAVKVDAGSQDCRQGGCRQGGEGCRHRLPDGEDEANAAAAADVTDGTEKKQTAVRTTRTAIRTDDTIDVPTKRTREGTSAKRSGKAARKNNPRVFWGKRGCHAERRRRTGARATPSDRTTREHRAARGCCDART